MVIVDDHPLVAAALTAALRAAAVPTHNADAAGLLTLLDAATSPALAVLDLDLGADPDGDPIDGVDLVPRVRAAAWDVLILSGSSDRTRLVAAVAAGALGWIPKSERFDIIVATVALAASGGTVMDAEQRERVLAEHRQTTAQRLDLDRRWARLTPREREVLGCLVNGKRVADIAREFVVSPATVRTQVKSVLSKLEVSSQLEAVAVARRV